MLWIGKIPHSLGRLLVSIGLGNRTWTECGMLLSSFHAERANQIHGRDARTGIAAVEPACELWPVNALRKRCGYVGSSELHTDHHLRGKKISPWGALKVLACESNLGSVFLQHAPGIAVSDRAAGIAFPRLVRSMRVHIAQLTAWHRTEAFPAVRGRSSAPPANQCKSQAFLQRCDQLSCTTHKASWPLLQKQILWYKLAECKTGCTFLLLLCIKAISFCWHM